ncbi:hypothetical protein GCM10027168_35530 [Streptomyces capparidis]
MQVRDLITHGSAGGAAATALGTGHVGHGSASSPDACASNVRSRQGRFSAASQQTPHNARLLVTAALADWRLYPVLDDAVLCADELVINAVRHASCARHGTAQDRLVSLSLRLRGWWALVLEVADDDPCLPRRSAGDGEEFAVSGRGLAIVDALADQLWWARSAGGGKFVLARFDLARYDLPSGWQGPP